MPWERRCLLLEGASGGLTGSSEAALRRRCLTPDRQVHWIWNQLLPELKTFLEYYLPMMMEPLRVVPRCVFRLPRGDLPRGDLPRGDLVLHRPRHHSHH